MTKIAYNRCFGGFSLSEAAILRYAEIKGITLYPSKDGGFSFTTYWTVPPDNADRVKSNAIQQNWKSETQEARVWANKVCADLQLDIDRTRERTDPIVVQVIEELRSAANGMCADLAIAEVPAGTKYRIDEYDGRESVMTVDDYEWSVA